VREGGIFRVSNAVADPGIDERGAKGGSGGLAPQVYYFRVSNDY